MSAQAEARPLELTETPPVPEHDDSVGGCHYTCCFDATLARCGIDLTGAKVVTAPPAVCGDCKRLLESQTPSEAERQRLGWRQPCDQCPKNVLGDDADGGDES